MKPGSVVCNFVNQLRRGQKQPQPTICSAELTTFGQQAILSASLQDPLAGDDSANFQPVPENDYDPRSSASSKRPPRFSAGQREPWPANPEEPLSCEEFSSQHCTQCHPSDQLAYPPRSSAGQTPIRGSSANLQDLRPARTTSLRQLPASSTSRLAKKQEALASKRKRQPGASLRGSSPHIIARNADIHPRKLPSHHRSAKVAPVWRYCLHSSQDSWA